MPAGHRATPPLHARPSGFRDTRRRCRFFRAAVTQDFQVSPLSLEEIGLYNLLRRVHAGQGVADGFLRFNLLQRGMVLDGEPLRLSDRGLGELRRLASQLPAAVDG